MDSPSITLGARISLYMSKWFPPSERFRKRRCVSCPDFGQLDQLRIQYDYREQAERQSEQEKDTNQPPLLCSEPESTQHHPVNDTPLNEQPLGGSRRPSLGDDPYYSLSRFSRLGGRNTVSVTPTAATAASIRATKRDAVNRGHQAHRQPQGSSERLMNPSQVSPQNLDTAVDSNPTGTPAEKGEPAGSLVIDGGSEAGRRAERRPRDKGLDRRDVSPWTEPGERLEDKLGSSLIYLDGDDEDEEGDRSHTLAEWDPNWQTYGPIS